MATGTLAAIGGLVALFVLLDPTDLLLIRAGKRPLPGWRRTRADHLIARTARPYDQQVFTPALTCMQSWPA